MKFKDSKLTTFSRTKNYLFGIFWILVSITIFVSVFSYSENDPSFNNISTHKEIHNYLGAFGSYFADLRVQLIGMVSVLIGLVFFILGIKIILNKIIYNKLQKFLSFFGILISSSIIFDNLLTCKYCEFGKCGGILGKFFSESVYYDAPQYSIITLCLIIFLISLSYFIDIRKNWWYIMH